MSEFTASSDDVTNESDVSGASVTIALDNLYTRRVTYLDQVDAPIALWNFNDTLNAVLGPNLTLDTGNFGFTDLYPGVRGIWLSPSTRFSAPPTPNLILLGAMSVEIILMQQSQPPHPWMCGVGGTAGSELAADNVSWAIGSPSLSGVMPFTQRSLWEQGAGSDVQFVTSAVSGSPSLSFIHQVSVIGYSRSAGGVVQPYMDGRTFGPPSAPLTMPTGGGSGVFTLGGQLGETTVGQILYMSIAVYDRERSASEFRGSYNRAVGQATGLVVA